jgi:hypothetical protein
MVVLFKPLLKGSCNYFCKQSLCFQRSSWVHTLMVEVMLILQCVSAGNIVTILLANFVRQLNRLKYTGFIF